MQKTNLKTILMLFIIVAQAFYAACYFDDPLVPNTPPFEQPEEIVEVPEEPIIPEEPEELEEPEEPEKVEEPTREYILKNDYFATAYCDTDVIKNVIPFDSFLYFERGESKYILTAEGETLVQNFNSTISYYGIYYISEDGSSFGVSDVFGNSLLECRFTSRPKIFGDVFLCEDNENYFVYKKSNLMFTRKKELGALLLYSENYLYFNNRLHCLDGSIAEVNGFKIEGEVAGDGWQLISDSNGLFGYVNNISGAIIQPKYLVADSFVGGYATVMDMSGNKKLIDGSEKIHMSGLTGSFYGFNDGYAVIGGSTIGYSIYNSSFQKVAIFDSITNGRVYGECVIHLDSIHNFVNGSSVGDYVDISIGSSGIIIAKRGDGSCDILLGTKILATVENAYEFNNKFYISVSARFAEYEFTK